jgi:hypothetical protein
MGSAARDEEPEPRQRCPLAAIVERRVEQMAFQEAGGQDVRGGVVLVSAVCR